MLQTGTIRERHKEEKTLLNKVGKNWYAAHVNIYMKGKQVKNIIIRDGYLYGVDDDFMDLAIDGLIEEFVTINQ